MPELNDRYEQTRIKDLCGLYSVQNCHLCDDTSCGDNLKWRDEKISKYVIIDKCASCGKELPPLNPLIDYELFKDRLCDECYRSVRVDSYLE